MIQINQALLELRSFFHTGATKKLAYRKTALERMLRFIKKEEDAAVRALGEDLGKSPEEAYLTELSLVYKEIQIQLNHMGKWSRPKRVSSPVFLWPSKSQILPEPYGVVLIMSPWNYPLQLALVPLIGAIAAGNTVVLKCSPFALHTAAWIEKLVLECFDPEHVRCVYARTREEDYALNQEALSCEWDYIFYTGSTAMGKVVMRAASEHLTPICLELGGKSPCIVDATANLSVAAKRIVWGKLINAGQTCVAPDYICVSRSCKEELIQQLILQMKLMYGDLRTNPHYSKLVHSEAISRLQGLLQDQTILYGGEVDLESRFMQPCIVDEPAWDSPLMQQEIFGPILPVIGYDSLEELCALLAPKEKPLALYVFASDSRARYVLQHTTSGGACVNDVVLHLSNEKLPFGGVGHSGMGAYHGKASFDCFTHYRSVLLSSAHIDIPLKYPPYKAFSWIKRAMR